MAAYFILTQDFKDLGRFQQEYIRKVSQYIEKHHGEVLVASFEAKPVQGKPAKGAVVIKFPAEKDALNWLNDPDYQELKEIRLTLTTNANAVLAPEYSP